MKIGPAVPCIAIIAAATAAGALVFPGHRDGGTAAFDASAVGHLERDFAVFDHARTPADALPRAFRRALRSGDAAPGPKLADARRVIASDGEPAYLVPTSQGVCAVSARQSLCASLGSLAGASTLDLCSPTLPAGRIEIEWLLPDGARHVALLTAAGSATHLTRGHNVYIAQPPRHGPPPRVISWTDRRGRHHAASTFIPAGGYGTCRSSPAPASRNPSADSGLAGSRPNM